MISVINSLLERTLHLRVRRVIKPRPLSDKGLGSNLIIEFTGPSGVGKSTLCNYYLKTYKPKFNQEILTRKDLVALAIGAKIDLSEIYNPLLSKKIKALSKAATKGTRKFERLNNFYVFLKHDYLIRNFLHDKIILLDEERMLKFILDEPEKNIRAYALGRVLIDCTASEKQIMHNIKERTKSRKALKMHKNLTDTELHKLIKEDKEKRNKIRYLADNKGIRLLQINTEDSLEENCALIDQYINNLLNINDMNVKDKR